MEVQHNQPVPCCKEQRRGSRRQQNADNKFKPERIAHPFLAPLPVILGGKNPCAGNAAENADIEHCHKLVDNGNAAHLLRTHLPYHDIVQKADEISNAILDNNRDYY